MDTKAERLMVLLKEMTYQLEDVYGTLDRLKNQMDEKDPKYRLVTAKMNKVLRLIKKVKVARLNLNYNFLDT